MAVDEKIADLTELTIPSYNDVIPIVDLSVVSTKMITVANLLNFKDVDFYGGLAAAIAAWNAAVSDVTLLVKTSQTLEADLTVNNNITLVVARGAIIDGAYTLTINGPFEAGLSQCFGVSITIAFGTGSVEYASSEWFPDADIGARINAAWATGIKKVMLPHGSFSYSTTIDVPMNGNVYILEGTGAQGGTTLTYTPVDASNAIEVVGDATTLCRAILKDFKLIGNIAGHGIVLDRCGRTTRLMNLAIYNFTHIAKAGVMVTATAGVGYTNCFTIDNCMINNNGIGLWAEDCNIFTVNDSQIENNIGYNLRIEDCLGVQFFGTTIQGSQAIEIANLILSNGRDSRGPNFYGCWIEEPYSKIAMQIQSSATKTMTQVGFYGCEIYGLLSSADTTLVIAAVGVEVVKVFLSNCFLQGNAAGAGDSYIFFITEAGHSVRTEHCEYLDYDTLKAGAGTHLESVGTRVYEEEAISSDVALEVFGVSNIDSSGGVLALTLADGTYIGEQKTIVMSMAGNNADVTIAHHETNDDEVARFDLADEYLILVWTGTEWATINSSCTFP